YLGTWAAEIAPAAFLRVAAREPVLSAVRFAALWTARTLSLPSLPPLLLVVKSFLRPICNPFGKKNSIGTAYPLDAADKRPGAWLRVSRNSGRVLSVEA